jgi:type VI secretion system protein ImpK
MVENDPFAPSPHFDKTVVGGRSAGQDRYQSSGFAPPRDHSRTMIGVLTSTGTNRLVAAAAPLLALASRIRSVPAQGDIEGLRQRVITELETFRGRGQAAGATPDQIRAAHYALCATIDDLMSNTPWGSNSLWASQGMVSTFHTDVKGGERFYDLLAHLRKDPNRNANVLELMYLCLSLGFEGRLRIQPGGAAEHGRIREELHGILRNIRGEVERDLSPHWSGIKAEHRPLTSYLPLWLVGLVAAVLLLATYMGFSYLLNGQSDGVHEALARLPPQRSPALEAVSATYTRPPPPVATPDSPLGRLRSFLAPEIAARQVEVLQSGGAVTIRVLGSGTFGSGSASVQEKAEPLLRRIGSALRDESGDVTIVGHTDNVGIRTVRFPSNWHLSKARAEAVRDMIAPTIAGVDRVSAVGRGDAEPIADNATAIGRERNRRIEFVLNRKGASQS